MIYRIHDKIARSIYDWGCRAIVETPPLEIKNGPLVICSMVCRRDLIMYLVAVKLLYRQIGEGTISILDDGSLDAASIALLNEHLGRPAIVDARSVITTPCPRGGTWERLLHILDLAQHSYVIQLDADILVRDAVPEVISLYKANRSFTLGTREGADFTSLRSAAHAARVSNSSHVQIAAEQRFDQLEDASRLRYVRGCSGFTGFAKGAVSRRQAEQFSVAMQRLVGDKWSQWGSEQVASSYLIANAEQSQVLPLDRFINYSLDVNVSRAALVHFIGNYRFRRGFYMRESRRLIDRQLSHADRLAARR